MINTTAIMEEISIDFQALDFQLDEREEMNMEIITQVIEGYLLTTIGAIGLIGNILAILVFTQQRVQKNFHTLMVTLAVFDIEYILMNIAVFALPQFSSDYKSSGVYYYLLPWILPLAQVGLTGSIYFTMAIALERYFTVCHPFFRVSHSWSSRVYVIPIVSFALLFNLPKFFELKTVHMSIIGNSSNSTGELTCEDLVDDNCVITIRPTALRLNNIYLTYYYGWFNSILNGFIPFFTLIILNSLTLKSLIKLSRDPSVTIGRGSRNNTGPAHPPGARRKEITLAKVSLVIVFVFIFCHALKWIPNLYELLLTQSIPDRSSSNRLDCLDEVFLDYIQGPLNPLDSQTHVEVTEGFDRT
eukprot:TCALIF_09412-PA protein Name:"Similar to FR FMRFamide receptor (Drosophila melanogaster)" AED:0.27 eAED:0.27 QI:370/0/0.5/0.5/0/0/2/0/357